MCFHWQHRAIEKYREEIEYKNLNAEMQRIHLDKTKILNDYAKYRDSHNNSFLTKLSLFFGFEPFLIPEAPHGFFAAQLFYLHLQSEVVKEALNGLK